MGKIGSSVLGKGYFGYGDDLLRKKYEEQQQEMWSNIITRNMERDRAELEEAEEQGEIIREEIQRSTRDAVRKQLKQDYENIKKDYLLQKLSKE